MIDCPDEWTNGTMGHPESIQPLLTLSDGWRRHKKKWTSLRCRCSYVTLEAASRRAIWRVSDAEVHDGEPGPAPVSNQQLPRWQQSHRIHGCRGRHIYVRTRNAEHFGSVVYRHSEHTAGYRAIEKEEVGTTIDRETCNRRHVIIVFNYVATVCNAHAQFYLYGSEHRWKTRPCSPVVKACAVERNALRSLGSKFSPGVCCAPVKELFQIIPMHMMNKEIIPGRKKRVQRYPL